MSIPIPYSSLPRRSLRERINPRVIIFAIVFGLLIGFPVYLYVDAAVSGGIKNRGDAYEVDLKAMSSFPFDQNNGTVKDVPEQWRALDGKTVIMVGEEAPGGLQARGVDQHFVLVYSVQKCCYSGSPQVQHFVQVTIPPGAKVNIDHDGSMQVKGKLTIEVTRNPETGAIDSIYHVLAEQVESV